MNTRAARSRTFGRWLGYVIVLSAFVALMALAGAIEGGW